MKDTSDACTAPPSNRVALKGEAFTEECIDSIRILGLPYTVKYKDVLPDGTLGRAVPSACKVEIATDGHAKPSQDSTLLHEVIEALNFHMEIKLEHRQISTLEVGLYQVLVDNPKFTKLFL